MKRHFIGLIGYGGFGRFLREAWSGIENASVAAVADSDATRDPGGLRFYSDWRELVADPHVDVVAVATPPSTHADIACAALDAGKHVLVEKPVATSLEDAARIRRHRDRSGCVATVDFMLRFNPIVEALYTWCRSGCFGRLRRVAVENYAQDESLPPGHWFWDPEVSGGILVEHAVHFFDVVQWCSGHGPVRVDGTTVARNPEQEDRVMAAVVHDDGLVATHYHAFSGPDFFERTSMRFVFDLMKLEVDGWIPMSGRASAILTPDNETELSRLPGFRTPPGDGGRAGIPRSIHAAGTTFEMIGTAEGTFALPQSKSAAYRDALAALMSDVLAAVDDPAHVLRVRLEDGVAALEIALRAAADARARRAAHSQW